MQPCILARDTFYINEYKYDVEIIMLYDLIGKKSVVNTSEFKEFAIKEKNSNKYKVYN